MTHSRSLLLLVAASSFLLLGLPVAGFGQAQHSPYGWYVEANAGSWSPGPDVIDADSSFLLRLGWKSPETRWGIDVQYGVNDGTITGLEVEGAPVEVDVELNPLDLSLSYFPIMNRRFQLMIIGGPGWTFGEAKAKTPIDDENNINLIKRFNRSSLTLNLGLGARVFFTDNVYLRLDARARWNEKRDGDDIDNEYTAGIGFNI